MLKTLEALERLGLLSQLYKHGIISPKVKYHYEIYMQVQAQMQVNGGNKNKAVLSVADKMSIDESTVWKALKKMSA